MCARFVVQRVKAKLDKWSCGPGVVALYQGGRRRNGPRLTSTYMCSEDLLPQQAAELHS